MVLLALFAVGVQAQVTSWTHGDNIICTWNENTYTLTLSGTGEMKDTRCDYLYQTIPYGNMKIELWVSGYAQTIVIDEGITSIGVNAFSHYKYVTKVELPSTVTKIGTNAFNGCEELATIDGVINEEFTIGNYALDGTKLIGADGILYFGKNLVKAYTSYNTASVVEVKPGTTKIYPNAFEGYGMTSITIPSTVTSIEDGTFMNCTKLTNVTFEGNITSWGSNIFSGCTSLPIVDGYQKAGDKVIVKVVDQYRSFYDLSGISYIAEEAFLGLSGKVECFGSIPMAAGTAFKRFKGLVFVNDGDEAEAISKLNVDEDRVNCFKVSVSDEAEFSTVSLPFCSNVSELKGVKVYRAEEDGDVIKLVKVEKMDKEYGYVVYRQGGGDVIFTPLGEVYNESAPNLMVNCYKGANEVFGSNKYVLVLGNNGVGFQCLDQKSADIPAGKSYLEVSSGSTQKLYRTIFDDTTGIEDVYEGKTSQKKSGIYSLSGQRLSQARKGLNIINGQVVLK